MGMSTHVVGYVPRDEKWNKYEKIYRACDEAGIDIPDEVLDYFDDEPPYDKPGKEVDIDSAVADFNDEYRSGYSIDLSKLPDNVTILRFYNSW